MKGKKMEFKEQTGLNNNPKKIEEKKKIRRRKYVLRPTIANLLVGKKRKRPVKLAELTGFETLRT